MKAFLILLSFCSLLAALPAEATFRGRDLSVTGVWALRDRQCKLPQASLWEKFKLKVSRQDRMAYHSELMVMSPDGELQKFDNEGHLTAVGQYALVDDSFFSMRYDRASTHMPSKMNINVLERSGMILTHTGDPNCAGVVYSTYGRVTVYPEIYNEVK